MNYEAPPTMPVYVNDWLTGQAVLMMDDDQQGLYFRLLCMAWKADPPCSIPADPKLVAKMLGVTPARWKKVGELVMQQFRMQIEGHPNRLRNRKQWEVYCELMERRKRRSLAGRRGAESRWSGDDPDDDPDSNANGNASSNANGKPDDKSIANGWPSIETEEETESSSEGEKKKPSPRARRSPERFFPDDFEITEAMREWAERECPTIDIERETRQFEDYHRAKESLFRDWTRAWYTWMRNAVRFQKRDGRGPDPGSPASRPRPVGQSPELPSLTQIRSAFESFRPRIEAFIERHGQPPDEERELRSWDEQLWKEERIVWGEYLAIAERLGEAEVSAAGGAR